MKIVTRTKIKKSVGNVIVGTVELVNCQSLEDKGSYYSVAIHPNRERRYSKNYWECETIEEARQ